MAARTDVLVTSDGEEVDSMAVLDTLPAEKNVCYFFQLPPEIRNTIYELILLSQTVDSVQVTRWYHQADDTMRYSLCYTIIQTCRQIQNEALPILFGSRPLEFSLMKRNRGILTAWMRAQSDAAFTHMRHLLLEDYQHWYEEYPIGQDENACPTLLDIDLHNLETPVMRKNQDLCGYCDGPEDEDLVEQVREVIGTLRVVQGRRVLTKGKFLEICEAAA